MLSEHRTMNTGNPKNVPLTVFCSLDKPEALYSNTALQKARGVCFHAEKAGHTAALDPLATGLLPVCFGEATKFAQYPLDADSLHRHAETRRSQQHG